mgnify:CR=1 FL=1
MDINKILNSDYIDIIFDGRNKLYGSYELRKQYPVRAKKAAGIVLAIMIFPLLITLFLEVFSAVPRDMLNASLSLGETPWQTVKKVLLKKAMPGMIASTVLAISRAFGETIAVLMVCGGNVPGIPHSVFDSGYPLPVLIANNFGETFSIPLYDSALLFAALLLFVIIFIFNAISRIILVRVKRKIE